MGEGGEGGVCTYGYGLRCWDAGVADEDKEQVECQVQDEREAGYDVESRIGAYVYAYVCACAHGVCAVDEVEFEQDGVGEGEAVRVGLGVRVVVEGEEEGESEE